MLGLAVLAADGVSLAARIRGECRSCAERIESCCLRSGSWEAHSRVPAFGQSDADFLAARAAFERGDRVRLDALAPKLSNHILASYVEFWQKKLNLESHRRRRGGRLPRSLAEIAARGQAARRLAEDIGEARPVGELRRPLPSALGRGRRARMLRRAIPSPARRRRGARGREAALVHGPELRPMRASRSSRR